MILDRFLTFSLAQSVAIAAGTLASDVIDFGINSGIPSSANGGGARDMGIGDTPALKFVVQPSVSFASAASAGTLTVSIQGAVDDGTGNPSTFSTWWVSPIYTTAQLNAGSRLLDMDFPRPPDGVAVPRFVRLLYTVASATMTAGTMQAHLVLDRDDQMYNSTDNSVQGGYPAGINVAN